jgi:small subunit ribosomal protein S20
MPNTESAKKSMRQTEDRTLRNKVKRSSMRTFTKKVRAAVEAKDKAAAEENLAFAYKAIDKCARANIVHANKAGHQKSQLAKLVGTL